METTDSTIGVELLKMTRRCRGIDKYVSSSARLSVDEMHCLCALSADHPSSVKRLYELINVSPTRASKILRQLEQKGLVARALDPEDHRKGNIVLTERGAREAGEIFSLYSEVGSELLGSWRTALQTDFSWLARTFTPAHHDSD